MKIFYAPPGTTRHPLANEGDLLCFTTTIDETTSKPPSLARGDVT